MDDTQLTDTTQQIDTATDAVAAAEALRNTLAEHKAEDPVALDLRSFSAWADFFVIGTASSRTHQDALLRSVKERAAALGLEQLRRAGARIRSSEDNDDPSLYWSIIDFGTIVVHVMSKKAREFYALERLWAIGARRESAEPEE
jgi:ribosome-associated protein